MSAAEVACVTGRFQPVHEQHVELLDTAARSHRFLAIGITNPDTASRAAVGESTHRHTAHANPFTFFERARLIAAVVRERGWQDRTVIVPFDLSRPQTWTEYVPLGSTQFVRAYSAWEHRKAAMLASGGYRVECLPGVPEGRIAASTIRAAIRSGGDGWHALVPSVTVGLLQEMLGRAPLDTRP